MSNLAAPISPTAVVSACPPAAPAWIDVARLCRRICALVERGDIAEADRLRTGEFSAAVAAVRAADAEGTVFAVEAERLVHTTLLADILAPLIAARLQLTTPLEAPALARIATLPPESPVRVRTTAPANIADFIDEMLALDRPSPAVRDQRAS